MTISSPSSVSLRVLLVDDNQGILDMNKELLSEYFQCVAMNSAADALQVVLAQPFDCIVCDLSMPGMDGMQFYRQLELQAPHYLPRIIFMTGGGRNPETENFLKHPHIQFCEKPCRESVLVERIKSLGQANQKRAA